MNRALRITAIAGSAGIGLFVLGFLAFSVWAGREPPARIARADGIVVLTGGERRVDEGLRLLEDGLAKRLLVSGANPLTRREDVQRHAHANNKLVSCCVDMGYLAQDTIGNAEETRRWALAHHFKRLIVVTSSYHMPRSLTELARELPDVELIAYPVIPRSMADDPWWRSPGQLRRLAAEYVKLWPSVARYAMARVLGAREATANANPPGTSAGLR